MNEFWNAIRYLLFFSLFYLISISAPAQKHDNTWIFGYYASAISPVAGLDFYFGAPNSVGFNPPFNFIGSSDACMSNAAGDLQFYSNGSQVANWNNQILSNSSGFNVDSSGNYYNEYWQGALPIPFPDHPEQYVLFHLCGVYYNNNASLAAFKLFYSLIDMNANNGLGDMILKNQVVFSDTLLPCTMQATRHANGRDWWIVNHKAYSNKFYVSLLTPDGVVQNNSFNTGPSLTYFSISEGQSEFSPDGSKFAMAYNTFNSVYLFDFDRCSGVISYRDSVQIVPNDSTEWPVWGCAFSPNSRYLYANTNNDLIQFDTWSPTMDAGMKIVAQHYGGTNYFFRNRLGPDGKMYMVSWGGKLSLNVMNSPDEGDTLCDFVQDQLQLVSYHGTTLPDFPNYRLGPIAGSVCDSLTNITEFTNEEAFNVSVWPNPNNGTFEVSYLLESNREGIITITDILGKIVYNDKLSQFSIRRTFQLSGLKSGVYELTVQSGSHRNALKLLITD